MKNHGFHDAAVVGSGPAGLATAVSLSLAGVDVVLIGPRPTRADTRTAALFAGSVHLLENIGIRDALARDGTPLHGIRLVDDMGGLLRAPEVMFPAHEAGLPRFGYNIANSALVAALTTRAEEAGVHLIDATVANVSNGADAHTLELGDGRSLAARLVVGADGRQSPCRAAAGIEATSWSYEQCAITTTFAHQRPHNGISTEFHRPSGPLTVVPCAGNTSSLVWVERPATAQRLLALDENAFRAELETHLQGLLGGVGQLGSRGMFPLSGLRAEIAGRNRIALVGEAAHVIPPIGAQGLNLGLRDVACLEQCVVEAQQAGDDIGAAPTLQRYDALRRSDIATRIWAVDALNRTLLTNLPPVQALRGIGMHLLKLVPQARRAAITRGLGPSHLAPRLLQPRQPTETDELDALAKAGHDRSTSRLQQLPSGGQ